MANDKANVSTVRGVIGGYLFRAPVGTTLPTDSDYPAFLSQALPAAWECVGYLNEDGTSHETDMSTSELRDMNGDVVDVTDEGKTDTITYHPMEVSPEAMRAQYGSANVSGAASTGFHVHHNWTLAGEHSSYIARYVLKNGRRWDRIIPDAQVTALGTETQNKTTGTGRDVTLTLAADANGDTIIDHYGPATGEAAANVVTLSALTIGSVTLSPAFDPSITTYTATTTNTTNTVTATATDAENANVTIKNGGTTVMSGQSATWATGTNVLSVVVTNGGATKAYTVIVTKESE